VKLPQTGVEGIFWLQVKKELEYFGLPHTSPDSCLVMYVVQ